MYKNNTQSITWVHVHIIEIYRLYNCSMTKEVNHFLGVGIREGFSSDDTQQILAKPNTKDTVHFTLYVK